MPTWVFSRQPRFLPQSKHTSLLRLIADIKFLIGVNAFQFPCVQLYIRRKLWLATCTVYTHFDVKTSVT